MNDTVKLIIEIPADVYRKVHKHKSCIITTKQDDQEIVIGVRKGILLDDVKAEIEKKTDAERIKQNLSELAQYNADMLKAFNAGKELAEKEKPSADIMECARAIKEYCDGQKCDKCLFKSKDSMYKCSLFHEVPCFWDLPEGEKDLKNKG